MSIAYADPEALAANDKPTIIHSATPTTKFATSALLLVATIGGTTAGVPFREAVPIVSSPNIEGNRATAKSTELSTLTDAQLVKWAKDESGLTWDQLARAFDVSRRAVHLWAGGGRVSAGNAEALQAFSALVREAANDSSTARRNALLAVGPDGLSPIDRFRRAQHNRSAEITGSPLDPAALLGEAVEAGQ